MVGTIFQHFTLIHYLKKIKTNIMFNIISLVVASGDAATITQIAPSQKPIKIGDQLGPQGAQYTINIKDKGIINLIDIGDSVKGAATWAVQINNSIDWFYDGEGQMSIAIDTSNNVTISGGAGTVTTKLLPIPSTQPVQLKVDTELMKNQKQAQVMDPQKTFQVLQSAEGHALFFSIGSDNVFYLTREVPGQTAGWVKTDLSSALSKFNNGIKIIAKKFVVSQNLVSNTIDIVLAIQGQTQDYVYTSLGLVNTDATWSNAIVWTVQGYDNTKVSIPKLVVSDLYIAQSSIGEYIVADVFANPSAANKFIDRNWYCME
jgi:hypothetical protein